VQDVTKQILRPLSLSAFARNQALGSLGPFCAEMAALCLARHTIEPEASIRLAGRFGGSCPLVWEAVSSEFVESWADDRETAQEFGAYAVALTTLETLIGWQAVRPFVKRSCQQGGYDFLLERTSGSARRARMEVSGILVGDAEVVRRRQQRKLNQLARSDDTQVWPAYSVVVEFSEPLIDVRVREEPR